MTSLTQCNLFSIDQWSLIPLWKCFASEDKRLEIYNRSLLVKRFLACGFVWKTSLWTCMKRFNPFHSLHLELWKALKTLTDQKECLPCPFSSPDSYRGWKTSKGNCSTIVRSISLNRVFWFLFTCITYSFPVSIIFSTVFFGNEQHLNTLLYPFPIAIGIVIYPVEIEQHEFHFSFLPIAIGIDK